MLRIEATGGDEKFPVHERIGYFSHNAKELKKHWFTPGIENALMMIVSLTKLLPLRYFDT